MRCTINVAWDVSAGVLTHNVLATPIVPVPTPMISIEMICTQMWTLGFLLGQNKLTTKVLHKSGPIVLDGHDCGTMIPDITPLMMANLFYVISWPFSSRKIAFASSTVQMEGTPTGCAQIGLPLLPMMTCGDPISAPTSLVLSNQLNTVTVGITLFDLFMGTIGILISIIIDFVFEMVDANSGNWTGAFSRENAGKVTKSIFGRQVISLEVMEQVARTAMDSVALTLVTAFVKKLGPVNGNDALKRVAGAVGGLLTSTLQGNPTFSLGVGMPGYAAKVSVGAAPAPTAKDSNPSMWSIESQVLGYTRDTRGGGSSWGTPL
ncbi:MAG: hypothetical protein EXR75_15880 [Myxococcales bacterium]|nr:hypothetical protein [Myxococcales bacterium]